MGNRYAYDIETMGGGSFLSYVFMPIPESPDAAEGEAFEFVVYGERDDRPLLGEWIRGTRPQLVGFNNYAFDDLLLVQTLLKPGADPRSIYGLGQKIISRQYSEIPGYDRLKKSRDKLESIDLMLLLGNRYNSLKEIEAKLGLPVLELPFDHTEEISPAMAEELLRYNRHDVRATIALYWELLPIIQMREEIGQELGVHALSSTDSTLANELLDRLYGRPRVQSSPRDSVKLSEIITNRIQFESPEFSELEKKLRGLTLGSGNGFRFSEKVSFGENTYKLGIGGLHSEDAPGAFEAGEGLILRDGDVSSYYPQIMLELGIAPAHCPGFLEFYRGLVERRLQAKAQGDKAAANALKIVVNSVFGKLGYEYFWLYDPKAFLAVTINGQLLLLDLIEKLERSGIRVLSANTDGILCAFEPGLEEAYTAVTQAWEERTGFSLEFTDYSRFVRRDVNNYIARSSDGRKKAKGIFVTERPLSDSYRAPIIARALSNYFLEGTRPEETLEAEPEIMPFAYVFKPGKKFSMVYQTAEGEDVPAPRVNRYYIAQSGGTLVKLSEDRRDRVRAQAMVLINGELPEKRPADLDLGFYLAEIWKVISKIEGDIPELKPGGQMSLFGGANLRELRETLKSLSKAEEGPSGAPLLDSSYSLIEISEAMGAIEEGEAFRAPCPVHEGKDSRSLKLSERDGRLDLYCFAGCKAEDVLQEIERRLDSGEGFRRPKAEPLGEIVASYEYRDEFGRLSFRKNRHEPKDFRIESWDPESGRFEPGLNGHRPILYRYPELLEADKVIIVEGEKDADNGSSLGLPGYAFTCNFDGAGNWARAYSQALAHKTVFIIPDKDPPGRDHARAVSNSAAPFAESVSIVELPGENVKDLSDWLELGHTGEELLELIEGTEPLKAGELFEERDLNEYPPGDPGNARAVIRLYGDRVAFTDGFGPMFYKDGFWNMGGIAQAEINKAIEDTLWRRREIAVKSRDEKLEPIIKQSYPSSSRINSTRRLVENYTWKGEDAFGGAVGIINVLNGVIDMRTGALYPNHSSYGFTYRLPVTYVPGSRSETWDRFLEETLPDPEERDYLQELIGYIATGETREEILVYIVGPTRSGKGTFTETLQYTLGPLAQEINIRSLMDGRSGSDQNFDLAGLYNARFVHASESKDTDWLDSAKVKLLSGGNEIRAAFKGRDLFSFRPKFTVLITSNDNPRMKAEDSAAWYRVRAIEFPVSKAGAEDKRLKRALREPGAQSAILSWIIEGAVRWYSKPSGLVTPQSVIERTAAFRDALDYVFEFLGDHYEIAPPELMGSWSELQEAEFYVPLDLLYGEYKLWHDDNGAPELSKINFARKLRQRLGGANLQANQTRAIVPDPITGEEKRVRVIAGVKPKSSPSPRFPVALERQNGRA